MGLLSIVVPMYNVERYLDECLRSLQVQTWSDLEVVMVDDGSPDNSAAIAKRFAQEDPRFKLVQQDNAGLGAARNAGVRHAQGEFLTFVDSDDVIPPHAFGAHIESLRSTGSDFSSGNVYRINELGTRQSPMHRDTFAAEAKRTHVTRRDSLLIDRLATNKVWRRGFWDAHTMEFPTGVLYEDESVAIPLHFLAEAMDVLTVPVYFWRERPSDDKSITQDRLRPSALEDRFAAVTAVSDFLLRRGSPEDKRRWDTAALRSDLRTFIQVLDQANEGFRRRFIELGNIYLSTVEEEVFDRLPAIERLKWHLVRRRMAAELVETIVFSKSVEKQKAPAVRHGLTFYAEYPFKDDPARGVPRSVYRLDSELKLRQKAESAEWRGGRLVVSGRVCLRFLRPNKRIQQSVRAAAVERRTGQRVKLPVAVHKANEFRLPSGFVTARRDWGGYEIAIDPAPLLGAADGGTAEWYVELRVVNRGMPRTEQLGYPVQGAVRRPAPAEVSPGVWLRPEWRRGEGLTLVVDRSPVTATAQGTGGDGIDVALRRDGAAPETGTLVLVSEHGDRSLRFPLEPRRSQAKVGWEELCDGFHDRRSVAGCAEGEERWQVYLESEDGARSRVSRPSGQAPGYWRSGGIEVSAEHDSAGWFRIRVAAPTPLVADLKWEGARLRLAGEYQAAPGADGTLSMVVRASGRVEEHEFPLPTSGSGFSLEFSPMAMPAFGGRTPLTPGTYEFHLRRTFADGTYADVPARLERTLVPSMPSAGDGGEQEVHVDVRGEDMLLLQVGSVLRPEERGGYAQQLLREATYPRLRGKPVAPGILFDSYSGKQYSDSPRGIYEEMRRRGLDHPASWNVRDRQVRLPEGLSEVRHSSREYFEGLARSEYIVSNAHLPLWFEKRPGQTVVQTWHGSMLKRIGFDIEHVQFATRDYHDRLRHETNQWDFLVSPSPWATPILRRAFQFEGEILETGYPRNDIFFAPGRDEFARGVRERIGIPEGKRVVLYAPTWRDDKFYARGKYKLDLHLDLRRMRDSLGDDYVLLFRRHPNIADRVPASGGEFVIDVSTYPEIQELFLVTDVLVTDYSSLMFDFANTGRPMLFFTYDLLDYRDSLRGFYFDFEQTAPGPLLETSDQVIAAIAESEEVRERYSQRYEAFVEQFCPLDDGNAAARVVDRLFPG